MAAVYNRIIKYIDANIKDEITIKDIAKMTGYSENHIYKIFKQFSPYPIMDYIRRKRLYAAANEMYTGRKLFEIALDYGYETPAGFYKAFKSIFGCSPSEYSKNLMKEGFIMILDNIKNVIELNDALAFANKLYPNPNINFDGDSNDKYSRKFWIEQWNKHPELLLLARDNNDVCGICLGWSDDGQSITIGGDGVSVEQKNKGVHEALFVEIEKRAKKLGFHGIVLGIGEGEEEFYAKLGYIGKTLIQSEKHNIDDLKKFNEQYKNYEVTGSGVYEGYINQLWLNTSLLDKDLKNYFEEKIGECWVQIIVSKEL